MKSLQGIYENNIEFINQIEDEISLLEFDVNETTHDQLLHIKDAVMNIKRSLFDATISDWLDPVVYVYLTEMMEKVYDAAGKEIKNSRTTIRKYLIPNLKVLEEKCTSDAYKELIENTFKFYNDLAYQYTRYINHGAGYLNGIIRFINAEDKSIASDIISAPQDIEVGYASYTVWAHELYNQKKYILKELKTLKKIMKKRYNVTARVYNIAHIK